MYSYVGHRKNSSGLLLCTVLSILGLTALVDFYVQFNRSKV